MTLNRLPPLIGALALIALLSGCASDGFMRRDHHDQDRDHHRQDAPDRDQDHHDRPGGDPGRHDGPPG